MAAWIRARFVIAFDITEQFAPRGIAIQVFAVVDQLGFQSAEDSCTIYGPAGINIFRGIIAPPTPSVDVLALTNVQVIVMRVYH